MAKHIFLESDFEFPESFNNSTNILIFSKRSPLKESCNEDAIAVFDKGDTYIFALADGAGGHPKGEEAAALVLNKLDHLLNTQKPDSSSYRNVIIDAIETTSRELIQQGVGARTTITVCEVSNNKARHYQVGDSTLLICGLKGKLKYRSTSHSPVGYAIEAGIVSEQEALSHPDLHYISNLVGDADMKIEVGPEIPLNSNDTVFLASDGIFDNFSPEEIVALIRKGNLSELSIILMDLISHKIYDVEESKKDDISFILFKN